MPIVFIRSYELRIFRQYRGSLRIAVLNNMMKNSIQQGQLENALKLLERNPKARNVVSWNIVIAWCVKYNQIQVARQLFDKMPERDVVSWNTLLSALQKIGDHQGMYHSYLLLQRSGLRPSEYTFSTIISSISGDDVKALIPQLHAQIVSLGHNSSAAVGSTLMRGYRILGDHSALSRVFDDILQKGISVWNALILGYMDFGLPLKAQRAFNVMPIKNVSSWTIMVDGYLKNKQVENARYIFDGMKEKNVVSWTAMISGYVRTGDYLTALELFHLMTRTDILANQYTFSSVLAACAGKSEIVLGEQVHASILKHGVPFDVILSTALVDMYAKCGNIEAANSIFESMPNKNLASWNTIIGGYAWNGLAKRALDGFQKMIGSGLGPNHITFVNILSACGHAGLVEEGEKIFYCMEKAYSIKPEKEHYACMVDLYGRAGHLDKAKHLIEWMPFEPDVVVWSALLGPCGLHCNSEFSSDATNAIHDMEKDHPALYSAFSKILCEKSKLEKKQKAGSRIG